MLIVIGVGMYSEFNDYSMITGSHHIIAPVAVLLAVGIFLFLLGVVGCVGAFKEQKCLLGMVSCSSMKQAFEATTACLLKTAHVDLLLICVHE